MILLHKKLVRLVLSPNNYSTLYKVVQGHLVSLEHYSQKEKTYTTLTLDWNLL